MTMQGSFDDIFKNFREFILEKIALESTQDIERKIIWKDMEFTNGAMENDMKVYMSKIKKKDMEFTLGSQTNIQVEFIEVCGKMESNMDMATIRKIKMTNQNWDFG